MVGYCLRILPRLPIVNFLAIVNIATTKPNTYRPQIVAGIRLALQ